MLRVFDLIHQAFVQRRFNQRSFFGQKAGAPAFAQPADACSGCEGIDY